MRLVAVSTSLPDVEITGIEIDSRRVAPGNLFAALHGAATDGRSFIPQALEKGATAILGSGLTAYDCGSAAVIDTDDPRGLLAKIAAAFHQPTVPTVLAVTGTNGKTSVTQFVRQMLTHLGHKCASFGTLGAVPEGVVELPSMTTPDVVSLHRALQAFAERGFTHVVLEASSHALDTRQKRLDGVRFAAAAATNLTQDHLDFHGTLEQYAAAKQRLFDDLLDGPAVLHEDALGHFRVDKAVVVGRGGAADLVVGHERAPAGARVSLRFNGEVARADVPVCGAFQADNIGVAVALVMSCGHTFPDACAAVRAITVVPSRCEVVAADPGTDRRVIVDFAHTPDALNAVIDTLGRGPALTVVFGAGGDRDATKRAPMGRATRGTHAILTDDNPRTEAPELIRADVLAGNRDAVEIGDRGLAIQRAVQSARAGQTVVIAGKGHETGQIINGHQLPFSDAAVARAAVDRFWFHKDPLWSSAEVEAATQGVACAPFTVTGTVHIDSRLVHRGDLFVAIIGPNNDGHDFVGEVFRRGGVAVVSRPVEGPHVLVQDTLQALKGLAVAARGRLRATARVIGVTGSVGKTTTKAMLAHGLAVVGKTHATEGNLNSQIGVPLTLARMPRDTEHAVIEMGMDRAGQIRVLTGLARPTVAVVTAVCAVHSESFDSVEAIARAKAEIFEGLVEGGLAIIPQDSPYRDILRPPTETLTVGHGDGADVRITDRVWDGTFQSVTLSNGCALRLSSMKRVSAYGAALVVAALRHLGPEELNRALASLQAFRTPAGRGAVLKRRDGLVVIDESYNASPAATKAALADFKDVPLTVVLGDMLELADPTEQHAALVHDITDQMTVHTVGTLSRSLHDALPAERRGQHFDSVEAAIEALPERIPLSQPILIKGSNGIGLSKLVDTLTRRRTPAP